MARAEDERRPDSRLLRNGPRPPEEGEVSEIRFGIGAGDDEVADAWSDFLAEIAEENGIEVKPQRHENGNEDEPVILVYIEVTPPSDDEEDEEIEDGEDPPPYGVN